MASEGFVVYTGMYGAIKDILTLEQKGMLFDALHEFKATGKRPEKDNPIFMVFAFYENQMRLDNEKREIRVNSARENGKAGGRPRKTQETEQNPNNPIGFSETEKSYKEKVKVNVKDKENEKEKFDGSKAAAKFQSVYSLKAGRPRPMETAYSQCILRIYDPENGLTYQKAADLLEKRAAEFMTYCIKAKTATQYIPNPETWLEDDSWKIDWHQRAVAFIPGAEKGGNTSKTPDDKIEKERQALKSSMKLNQPFD